MNLKPDDMTVVDFVCRYRSGLECISIRLGTRLAEEVRCQNALMILLDTVLQNPVLRQGMDLDAFIPVNLYCMRELENHRITYALTDGERFGVVWSAWLFLRFNYGGLFESGVLERGTITIIDGACLN